MSSLESDFDSTQSEDFDEEFENDLNHYVPTENSNEVQYQNVKQIIGQEPMDTEPNSQVMQIFRSKMGYLS